ncbi:hypothetical protein, partial [Cronobacter malonaticus]|uniref:hypothetical protein n=1 Tax=Cronobacter malonaticus TaxID=413503 RepID=UPI001F472695
VKRRICSTLAAAVVRRKVPNYFLINDRDRADVLALLLVVKRRICSTLAAAVVRRKVPNYFLINDRDRADV